MGSNVISPVPNDQPLADQNGMPSQAWVGFFNDLWRRAGGSNASSNTSLQDQINVVSSSPANTIKGNNTLSTQKTIDLIPTAVTAMLSLFNASNKGLVPPSGGGTANFLRADGSFNPPPIPVILDYFASSKVITTSSSITLLAFTTASNSPAFSFTPAFTGKYKVYSSIPASADGASSSKAAIRIFKTSGTGTLLSESQGLISGSTGGVAPFSASVVAQSVYTMTAGSPAQFDIQGSLIVGSTLKIDGVDSPFYMFAERVS